MKDGEEGEEGKGEGEEGVKVGRGIVGMGGRE